MLGRPPRRLPVRLREGPEEERHMNTETKKEAMKPAQANQRKATEAWASRQRLVMFSAPLVISLFLRYSWRRVSVLIRYLAYSRSAVYLNATYLVIARVAFQLRGESDGSTEGENGVQSIEDDHDDRVAGPVEVEGGRD